MDSKTYLPEYLLGVFEPGGKTGLERFCKTRGFEGTALS